MAGQGQATSPPPSSPTSASNSQCSSTHPPNNKARCSSTTQTLPQPPLQLAESQGEDGASKCFKEELIEQNPKVEDLIMNFESRETLEKFQKYEADYAQRLLSKYFSGNNIYGGKIFEFEASVDDETIKASRWPCTQSFSDPQRSYEVYQEVLPSPDGESHEMPV